MFALADWRLFPTLCWAWPTGGLDHLLQAAICPDENQARIALDTWLNDHDIDTVEYRDHRLLAMITDRLGATLANRSEGARLLGLQRQLWTRSRMALAQAAEPLRRIVAAGIPVMLLKGAARIAADPNAARRRMAHDVDLLVPPERWVDALDILCDVGWTASSGESHLCLRDMAPGIRGLNFFKDRFGDIDLHQWAYGDELPRESLEQALWQNAVPAELLGIPVLVPSETDRVALAVANSGLDAHAHSDWLVDCAELLVRPLDWQRLLATLSESKSMLPAQVAMSYLARQVGITLPEEFLTRLLNAGSGGLLKRMLLLLQAKPRANWTALSRTGRGIAKQLCLVVKRRAPRPGAVLHGEIMPASKEHTIHELALRKQLTSFTGPVGRMKIRLDLAVELPGPRRRITFELNTRERHIARLQVRSLRRRRGKFKLRFEGEIEVPPEACELWVESRPGRQLRGGEDELQTERYAAISCAVIDCELHHVANPT